MLAIIADNRTSAELVAFARRDRDLLLRHRLVTTTEATARLLRERAGLTVEAAPHGVDAAPPGGAFPTPGSGVEAVICLVPVDADARHESALCAILRRCSADGIPIATNTPTAHILLASGLVPAEPLHRVLAGEF